MSLLRTRGESSGARLPEVALSSAVLSVLIVSVVEAAWPVELIGNKPSLLPALFAHTTTFLLADAGATLAYFALVICVEALLGPSRPRLRLLAHVVLSAGLSMFAYRTLLRYEPFEKYPVLIAPYVVAFLAFSVLGAGLLIERLGRWRIGWFCAACGFGGFALLHTINHRMLDDAYGTFHLSLLLISIPLLFFGILYPLRDVRRSALRRGTVTALVIVALGPWFAKTSAAYARPQALLHTMLGRVQVVSTPFAEADEGPRTPRQTDPDGVARFLSTAGFPALPPSFELEQYNVLLVTSEAVRFDATSLADEAHGNTPNLRALAAAGGYSFSAAHAPSSATLLSNASMMLMTYPSAAGVEVWLRSWSGRLPERQITLAERMKDAGYATFRVSHDFHFSFSENMLGLEQGFDHDDLIVEAVDEDGITLDRRIAEAAVRRIHEVGDRRFFGWVYFGGPHAPYVAHYDDAPSANEADRYRQELRYMDEQLGVLIDALRTSGLLDKTIVVFVADHGEELGDRGNFGHKTLFSECTQVPLVVRIPGMEGGEIVSTTSTLYTFPWLLHHGRGALKAAAEERMKNDFGPMMRATNGAVLVELVGADKMWTALVYPDKRIVYSFIANGATAYDLTRDPTQRRDLFVAEPDAATAFLAPVDAYRDVRRGMRDYVLDLARKPEHGTLRKARGDRVE